MKALPGKELDHHERLSLSLEPLEQRLLLQADWTFMVYMDADNSMEEFAIYDFLEMAHVGSTADVNVVAQMDRIAGFDASYDNWTDTRRGIVNNGDVPDTSWGASIGEQNMGDPATLENFVSWAITNYDAENYGLILWNMGDGWTEVCIDTTNSDSLTPAEVSTGVSNGMGVSSLDVLSFDAGLMGMLEVAYEVRNEAELMVAYEGFVPPSHMPYDDILADLTATPEMTGGELAETMASEYYSEYVGTGVTVSVVDLAEVGDLSDATGAFGDLMRTTATGADRARIAIHRGNSPSFTNQAYRDLGIFAQAVAADPTITSGIRASATAVLAEYDTAIVSFYADAGRGSGLSVYFPDRGDEVEAGYTTTLEFTVDTQWDEFIDWWTGVEEGAWTFMVYMCADNNLEPDAITDFLEMSSVGSTTEVNVVVQLDRHVSYSDEYGDWTGTRRGLVRWNDEPDDGWGEDIGEQNMGDPATLSTFVNWAMSEWPADSYAVILWNHGGGWSELMIDEDSNTAELASPQAVAQGDFDADGGLDVVTANADDDTISILFGAGDGTFGLPTVVPVGDQPSDVVVADFDGQNGLDIAVTNAGDDTVSVLLNDGSGVFALSDEYEVGSAPSALAAEDLDNDGAVDLVVANELDDTVSVLLNQNLGDGTFGTPAAYAVGDQPVALAAAALGDTDNGDDNYADLVVVNAGDDTVSVLLNDQSGAFSAAPTSPESVGSSPSDVAAGDLDGDDIVDIAVTNEGDDTVTVLFGDDGGDFVLSDTYDVGDRPTGVAIGYFDEEPGVVDPEPDLAVTNAGDDNVSILLGGGLGQFGEAIEYDAGDEPLDLVVGDHDGDLFPDLVVANEASNDVSVLINNGLGTFAEHVDYATDDGPSGIRAGNFDMDGDGIPDLVVANAVDDTVSVLLGNGDGTFAAASSYATGDHPSDIAVADFDGTNGPDVATADKFDNTVSVLLNNGAGVLSLDASYDVGNAPVGLTVGDINGDGDYDLAVANSADDNVNVLLGDGTGSFTVTPYEERVGDRPVALIAADLRGDVGLDLAVVCRDSDQIAIVESLVNTLTYELTGFQPAIFYDLPAGSEPTDITVEDLDVDGQLDLVFTLSGSDQVGIMMGDPANPGEFLDPVYYSLPVGSQPSSVTIADYNYDALLDLAVANKEGDNVTVFFSEGAPTFVTGGSYDVANGPVSIISERLNDDPWWDLAVANAYDGVSILLNNGPGSFAPPEAYPVGQTQPDSLTIAQLREGLVGIPTNIDLLGFDACLMNMLEVAYEIRDQGDYMVGSEEPEPIFGWPYDRVLTELVATPSMNAAELGDLIAYRYYLSWPAGTPPYDRLTQAVVDLGQVGALATAVDDLGTEFITNGTLGDRVRLAGHRDQATGYSMLSFGDSRDLGQILEGVAADGGMTSSIRNAAGTALAAYDDAIVVSYANPAGGTGLAIYFPEDREQANWSQELYAEEYYDWLALTFLDDTSWDEFLDWWLAGVAPVSTFSSAGATVTIFDVEGVADLEPDDVKVKMKGSAVKAIKIKAPYVMDGLGIVISGASEVGKIKGKNTGDVAFIASDAPIKMVKIDGGLLGENLNGRAMGGLIFPDDIDEDGSTFDATGLYVEGSIGGMKLDGSLWGDIWVEGSFGKYMAKGGDIWSDFNVAGNLEKLMLKGGDHEGRINVGGSMGKAKFKGDIGDGAIIDVEGSIGKFQAEFIFGGNPLSSFPTPGASIVAGDTIGKMKFFSSSTFILADDDYEAFRPTFGDAMINITATSIEKVQFKANMLGVRLVAGADLGADFLPGGTGEDADTYTVGHIGQVKVGNIAWDSLIAAGVNQLGWDIASGYNLATLRNNRAFIDGSTIDKVDVKGPMMSTWADTDYVGDPSDDPPIPASFVPYGVGSYTADSVKVYGHHVLFTSMSGEVFRHPYVLLEVPFDYWY